ncbi:MAG: hypothetical protein QME66_06575 [Candidatus Eisenbacteria bacterium]|nr:hypothetical protein [Candidatus Eisenbacteria bacterium]
MKVYDLGLQPGLDSMLPFHALAHLGREGLILVSPASTIACVGYFQDTNRVSVLSMVSTRRPEAF